MEDAQLNWVSRSPLIIEELQNSERDRFQTIKSILIEYLTKEATLLATESAVNYIFNSSI
jgi:hypothetical protein